MFLLNFSEEKLKLNTFVFLVVMGSWWESGGDRAGSKTRQNKQLHFIKQAQNPAYQWLLRFASNFMQSKPKVTCYGGLVE